MRVSSAQSGHAPGNELQSRPFPGQTRFSEDQVGNLKWMASCGSDFFMALDHVRA